MTRIICASNRVPHSDDLHSGGLSVAVLAGLKRSGGVWVGHGPDATPGSGGERVKVDGVDILPIYIPPKLYHPYYNGFHNQTLYPLFHELLGQYRYEAQWFDAYLAVNEIFAHSIVGEIESVDDVIWIHDAHLLPIAEILDDMGVKNRIGYFSHIPFPSRRVLRCLPCNDRLWRWLDSYDVVGFQTWEDCESYQRAKCYPIGIDWESVPVSTQQRDLLDMSMVGLDRLDYSKGLLHRFDAFERYMSEPHPSGLLYAQYSQPTRMACSQYVDFGAKVLAKADDLTRQHPLKFQFTPKAIAHSDALMVLGAADVALVTPLRDGMNLVAHEFVAAQNPASPGVLILSITAGAACTFTGALKVDPYDADGIALAIARALEMPQAERQHRHQLDLAAVKEQCVFDWWDDFIADLTSIRI